MWGLPIFFAIIQILLMVTVFKYDTPPAIKQRTDYETLTRLLSRLHIKEHVEWRMNEIVV